MKIDNIHLVYYSATYTSQRIGREIASTIDNTFSELDITMHTPSNKIALQPCDLLIMVMPVFGGLIPSEAAERLNMVHGANTPAIIVAVYGNRHYDNALCQMQEIATRQGFHPVSAGAFIARHSIFTTIASNRPDSADIAKIRSFAIQSADIIARYDNFPTLDLPGKPDAVFKKSGLYPTGDDSCTTCGTCVDLCPMNAISLENPQITNAELCTACGRCLVVCPNNSRAFRGELYDTWMARFESNFTTRREPEVFFPNFGI